MFQNGTVTSLFRRSHLCVLGMGRWQRIEAPVVKIGQFGVVGSCCTLFLCAFTLQKVPVLAHLSVLGNSSSKRVVLLLSHHGSEARRCAGMLSEGLELTHLHNVQPGSANCAENLIQGVIALIVCTVLQSLLQEQGTDSILALQACQVTGWCVSTGWFHRGFKCRDQTALQRCGVVPCSASAAVGSTKLQQARGGVSPPDTVCTVNLIEGRFCDWLCLY